ncbi:VWA domain-containing protein [Pelagicoccus sp. SDUM812005]|uniref:vWA domain-containing protein n=1 Tax=Pelagicoccus sp. SDUM812005 TaxID=3041257 RepID=UPI00280D702C|nr:VWA domain-containing protein [Pelagicoccus sp. SDUM812005]MDQ8181915.1 VWA domain-containing protein [Pelagicoccus sp. SDUM812005]
MKTNTQKTISSLLALPLYLSTLLHGQVAKDDDDEIFELSPFTVDASFDAGYSVSAGGAQDISYTRSQIAMGNIPQPATFTAEGLLSEYDLPLQNDSDCESLICVYGEAMPATLPNLPEATHLAQIGFASGLDATTWEREPLNLIAVVDKSGSMSGQPLSLVRKSLLEVLEQLDSRDQLSVVLYGDRSHVYMDPIKASPGNKNRIRQTIQNIQSSGSTNLESGLKVGYDLADESAADFQGNTRLMLFTDERPNTGNTSEHGFMTQMRNGSQKGYGLTTIGVGRHFGAELANTISSVRGGNLFYFPDVKSMQDKFANEFQTMVTELAYDMKLTLSPADGFKIAGVYGIPGDMLEWTDDGRSLYMEVETLFLSLRKGAIYFALAPEKGTSFGTTNKPHRKSIAQAKLSYELSNQKFPISQRVNLTLKDRDDASLGLVRGEALIDQYVSLKKATTLYHEKGDTAQAYEIVRDLSQRFRELRDSEIKPEQKLIKEIEKSLSIIAEDDSDFLSDSSNSLLSGSWIAHAHDNPEIGEPTLIEFHSNRILEVTTLDENNTPIYKTFAIAAENFDKRRHGQLNILDEEQVERLARTNRVVGKLSQNEDYAYDISRIVYKVRGEHLTLSIYDEYNRPENRIVCQRYTPEAQARRAEIDATTGLPTRG